jgi:uracil phosphoribosyltransferase
MDGITLVQQPLLAAALTRIRDQSTDTTGFRRAVTEASRLMAYEATRHLECRSIAIRTPVSAARGVVLRRPVVLVPVLRAGISMLSAFLEAVPDATVGFVGQRRDETTLQPHSYLFNVPAGLEKAEVLVLDPMLATGGSVAATVSGLKERGAKRIRCVHLLAAPEGVRRFQEVHPDVPLYAAALDRRLNRSGYIVPGLGDAGDRCFGT